MTVVPGAVFIFSEFLIAHWALHGRCPLLISIPALHHTRAGNSTLLTAATRFA